MIDKMGNRCTHICTKSLLKHVHAYKALKRDRTSLAKNRCAYSPPLLNSFIIQGGVSIFGLVLAQLTFNTSHCCL